MNYQYPGPNGQNQQPENSWSNPNFEGTDSNQVPPQGPPNFGSPNNFSAPNFSAPQGGPQGQPTSEEKVWAVFSHLGMLISIFISLGYLSWLIPLIIYLVYKDKSPFVRKAAAASLNFAITMTILSIIAWISVIIGLTLSVLIIPLALVLVGALLGLYIVIGGILFPILAAVKANSGENYTYPLTPELVK